MFIKLRNNLIEQRWLLTGAALVLLAASFPLTWFASSFRGYYGWGSVLTLELIAAAILYVGWRLIKAENPPTFVARLMILALVLHILAAMAWMWFLPRYGHGNPAEIEGYVFGDAFGRDKVAWRLARSPQPLWTAFVGHRKVDQYGGLLYLSAAVYRYLGSGFHQPMLMVLLAAALSALAVPFTWAFASLAWGRTEARLAAWLMMIYPDVVLLGSSQMREAFTMTFVIAGFYGLLRYNRDRTLTSLAWMIVPLVLCLPFTPPASALLLGGLLVLAVAMRFSQSHNPNAPLLLWIGLGVVIVAVMIGLFLSLRQFVPDRITNPFEMVTWWLTKSAQLQGYISAHASGWMQKVFDSYPSWVQLPVLLAYGVVQPFLPAALIAPSDASVWYGIAVWRATGWTFLLAFLIYAPVLAFQKRNRRAFNLALALILWFVILLASFRGGGDLWDNPRYRVMFAGLQAAVVAWALIEHRRLKDPWLRRALVVTGMVLAWFLPWYLRRYTNLVWPVVDLFKTLGMGLASAFLLLMWDWARTQPEIVAGDLVVAQEASSMEHHGDDGAA